MIGGFNKFDSVKVLEWQNISTYCKKLMEDMPRVHAMIVMLMYVLQYAKVLHVDLLHSF